MYLDWNSFLNTSPILLNYLHASDPRPLQKQILIRFELSYRRYPFRFIDRLRLRFARRIIYIYLYSCISASSSSALLIVFNLNIQKLASSRFIY
jgi:hypothetical protein